MNNVTIIMYHYIRDLQNSRFPGIKGLDYQLFIEQIEYLKKYYHFVTMEEVIHSIDHSEKLPDKAVLLTFDDAYTDHYLNVFPILDENKIQGSFYAPAKAILEHTILDVNKIHFILASETDIFKIIKDIQFLLDQYTSEYQLENFEYYYKKLAHPGTYDTKEVIFVKRLLQVELIEELRNKMVDTLFVKYVGMSESAFSQELYMNKEQLMTMQRHGMHIGSHGFNHYWWNRLSKQDLEKEIDLSVEFLDDIGTDMNSWTACYPYGSYDQKAVEMLESKGCKLAVTTEVRIADIKKDNRFLLPRLDTNDLPVDRSIKRDNWMNKY